MKKLTKEQKEIITLISMNKELTGPEGKKLVKNKKSSFFERLIVNFSIESYKSFFKGSLSALEEGLSEEECLALLNDVKETLNR
jgi:hypothetical protein